MSAAGHRREAGWLAWLTPWRRRVLGLVFTGMTLIQGAVAQTAPVATASTVETNPPDGPAPTDGYVASDAPVTQVFDALASAIGRPVVTSSLVQRKRISGRFDLSHPQRVLERLCTNLGFVTYFDGNVIYVYDMSELTNAMGSLRWIDVGTLLTFLDTAGLLSKQYPVRGAPSSHTFYVAGPPVYVDAVMAAAKHLDHAGFEASDGDSVVRVISLRHTFVRDRSFKLRDQTVVLPGIATVLADMLNSRAEASETDPLPDNVTDRPTDVSRPTDASSDASDTSRGAARDRDPRGSELTRALTRGAAMLTGAPAPGAPLPPLPDMYASGGRPRPTSRAIRVSSRPVVLAYPDTNSLIVKGSQADVDYLSQLIAQLDIEKNQIELSLWIIDISQSKLEQLGVRWTGRLDASGLGVSLVNGAGALMGGLSALDGPRFLASIYALSTQGEAQIVSRPLILTQENVPAIFDNNRTFYTKVVGERTSTLEQTTYGTLVSVIPRLTVDHGEIEMILDIEDGSEVNSGGDPKLVDQLPVVGRTHINTVARVPREMSLLIGGYTRHTVDESVSKIPLLGDIPVLGHLFRYKNAKAEDDVRVFLIQPRVLSNREYWHADAFAREPELSPGVSVQGAARTLKDRLRADAPAVPRANVESESSSPQAASDAATTGSQTNPKPVSAPGESQRDPDGAAADPSAHQETVQ